MTNSEDTSQGTAEFYPTKLEIVQASSDYPMEKDVFEKLANHNCYCEVE